MVFLVVVKKKKRVGASSLDCFSPPQRWKKNDKRRKSATSKRRPPRALDARSLRQRTRGVGLDAARTMGGGEEAEKEREYVGG